MSLIPYTITALEETFANSQSSGKNIVVGAVVSMADSAGTITMYDDSAGSNGSTAKTTGANGQVTVYVEPNSYTVTINGSDFPVVIADAVPVEFDTFVNASNASPLINQRIIVRERANANYIVNSDAALAGDITFANGLFGSLQVDGEANVLWFGALGDGVTDDQPAIQSALSRTPFIYLPSGNYAIYDLTGTILGTVS